MAERRNKRGRRNVSGHIDPQFNRRTRYEVVLRGLWLWEAFVRMPRALQDAFLQTKYPDPVLEFDATFPEDSEHRALRKVVAAEFARACIVIDDATITVRDFFAVIVGLCSAVRGSINQPGIPQEGYAFMHQASPLLETCINRNLPAVWDSLHASVICQLVAHSRLDRRLFYAQVRSDPTPNGKNQVRMIVSVAAPQTNRVRLDGGDRSVYRVGTSNGWHGIEWINWGPHEWGAFADGAAGGETTVFIQAHALRRMSERLNLPRMSRHLQSWLHESLKHPQIVERQGGDLLVEYRIMKHRLGYLVVTPIKDAGMAVVRTFKFLTMENTPESRMLRKRLRLMRPDVEYLRLDDLAMFTHTDLRSDAELRAIFQECGCGHLFTLANHGVVDFAPQPKPFAAEIRKYLRMAA